MEFIFFQQSRNNMLYQKLLKSKLGENWFFFFGFPHPSDEDVHKIAEIEKPKTSTRIWWTVNMWTGLWLKLATSEMDEYMYHFWKTFFLYTRYCYFAIILQVESPLCLARMAILSQV